MAVLAVVVFTELDASNLGDGVGLVGGVILPLDSGDLFPIDDIGQFHQRVFGIDHVNQGLAK